MHSLYLMDKWRYKENMVKIVNDAASAHDRICFISFHDPYHIVVEFLQDQKLEKKFVVVDASSDISNPEAVDDRTFVLPVGGVLDVYLFLGRMIKQQNVSMLVFDSLSALIDKHSYLPLNKLLTDMLLQVGSLKCSSSLVVFNEHAQHELISHLTPLISRNVVMQ